MMPVNAQAILSIEKISYSQSYLSQNLKVSISPGTFQWFDFNFRIDQKHFELDLRSDSISKKRVMCLAYSMLDRRTQVSKLGPQIAWWRCLSFFQVDSFFSIKFIMGPFIQGTGFLPLSFLFRIWYFTAPRGASFQLCQSILVLTSSFETEFAKFAARSEDRRPSKCALI